MRYRAIMTVVFPLLATASSLQAQQRITLDLRGAVAAPTQELAGTDLNTGIGVGGTIAFRLQEHLHVYGGWDWMHFGAEQSFAGNDLDFEETGYTGGLRFEHPFRDGGRALYRLEGGATWKHIEIEDEDGDLIADSKHGAGYEVGAGLLTPMGETWKLTTMLRYRALSRDFRIANASFNGKLQYGALEVGLSRRF